MATIIHRELCELHRFERSKKWCDHRAEQVQENEDVTKLWDFNILCDRVTNLRWPGIVVVDKKEAETAIIHAAVPGDLRVCEKETTKIQYLAIGSLVRNGGYP